MEPNAWGSSLLAAFATVPDPRHRRGRRHPLPAILALATAALLCGARGRYAIAQWGRLQEAATIQALGCTRAKTPAVSTLHLVFQDLDRAAFETALATWARAHVGEREGALAIDGKGLRGIQGEEMAGVRLVAVDADVAGLVLAQGGVRTDAHAAELTVAPALLEAVPLAGRVVTGDALSCQRSVCQQIVAAGGDYLVLVKENQPRLDEDSALLFAEPPPGEVFAQAEQCDRQGDRWEWRRLWTSTVPTILGTLPVGSQPRPHPLFTARAGSEGSIAGWRAGSRAAGDTWPPCGAPGECPAGASVRRSPGR